MKRDKRFTGQGKKSMKIQPSLDRPIRPSFHLLGCIFLSCDFVFAPLFQDVRTRWLFFIFLFFTSLFFFYEKYLFLGRLMWVSEERVSDSMSVPGVQAGECKMTRKETHPGILICLDIQNSFLPANQQFQQSISSV